MQTSVLEYLENSVKNFPDKCAYADDSIAITYSELGSGAKSIGSYILNNCEKCNFGVIFMEKTPLDIVAFMGILYAGGAYVPLDVTMPKDRIALINDNLSPDLVITDTAHLDEAINAFPGVKIIDIKDAMMAGIDEDKLDAVRNKSLDTDPCYVIYTSGSTGVPKGVLVCHRSLIDYMEHFCEEIGMRADDIIANQAPFYFDASLIDIYCTLKMGATMHIVPITHFSMPLVLLQFLEDKKITFIRWVPSALKIVSTFKGLDTLKPSSIRMVMFGAESMPTKCYNYWHKAYPEADFVQIYGPTEITGVCTYHFIDREYEDSQTLPIGKAFKNSEVFLLDEEDNLVTKEGDLGEICVKGTCLALGYINAPEVTAKVFTQNPLNKVYPELIYRTGDLASYNEFGELVFSSRKDFQIKHMGHRIELGEIEAAANAISGISSAIAFHDAKKDKIHLCFVSDTVDELKLSEDLKEKLQRYMIPNVMHKLEQMPLTLSGKADRVKIRGMFLK